MSLKRFAISIIILSLLSWIFVSKLFFEDHSFDPKITKTCSPRVTVGRKPLSTGQLTGFRETPVYSPEQTIYILAPQAKIWEHNLNYIQLQL